MTIEIPLSNKRSYAKYAGKYVAIIDDCDSDLAELNWFVTGRLIAPYAGRWEKIDGKKKLIRMHRIVLSIVLERELMQDEIVDHINNNPLDNRRENLRLVTHLQNLLIVELVRIIHRDIKVFRGIR